MTDRNVSIRRVSIAEKRPQLVLGLVGLTLLVIGKDLVHSAFAQSAYYLSESLLFGGFWLIFGPLLLLQYRWLRISGPSRKLLLPPLLSLLHIALFALLVFIISGTLMQYTFTFFRVAIHALEENGIACLLIYGLAGLFFKRNPAQLKVAAPAVEGEARIKVSYQDRTFVLDCKDILYVRSEKPYIALVTQDRTYLHNASLKSFLEEKGMGHFIQVHKSSLVNTEQIISYTSRKNGDYDLTLANGHCVRASRSYNHNFRTYFDQLSLG